MSILYHTVQFDQNFNEYASDPDVLLMLACQKGNKAAFETLMHKYYSRILNFIYRFIGRRDISEDLTQEVFLTLLRDATQYDLERGSVTAYLYGIARNY